MLTFYICFRLHSELVLQCLSEVVSHVRFLDDIHHILLVYQKTNTICIIRRRKSKNDRNYNIKHYTENWRLRTKRLTFEILVYSVIFCNAFWFWKQNYLNAHTSMVCFHVFCKEKLSCIWYIVSVIWKRTHIINYMLSFCWQHASNKDIIFSKKRLFIWTLLIFS